MSVETDGTVELSESGVSGYLRDEFQTGQTVKVQLALSAGPVTITALMRYRLGARYGFQFLDLLPEQVSHIRASCKGSPALLLESACGMMQATF